MSETHPARTSIPSVPVDATRPLWSVMIPTYNCAALLRQTLASVLAQDPGADAMQIEVVDDASTADDPAAVVREVGAGRVAFHRQAENIGHVRNFNSCLERSRGRLVHLLHGDDLVREGFYRTMEGAFDRDAEIGAAFCRYITIDRDGIWLAISQLVQRQRGRIPDFLELIASGQRLQVASMVVRRDVYERLGGFDERVRSFGEDWEMWVRIAAHYPVWYEPEALAFYRVHDASLSDVSGRSGQQRQDMLAVMELNRSHLPTDRADVLTRRARREWAVSLLRHGRRRVDGGDVRFPLSAIREAWAFERSAAVAARSVWVAGIWAVRLAQRLVGRGPRANGA